MHTSKPFCKSWLMMKVRPSRSCSMSPSKISTAWGSTTGVGLVKKHHVGVVHQGTRDGCAAMPREKVRISTSKRAMVELDCASHALLGVHHAIRAAQ